MINADTMLYCIFGHPARHSLSPILHNEGFRALSINAVYLAFDVNSAEDAVNSMRSLSIKGASITIPYKTDIVPFLDSVDSGAKKIGAVNTVVNSNGYLTGYNTDGIGALNAIEDLSGPVSKKNILIIGTGGSSRAIAFTAIDRGAKIILAGRSGDSQKNLYADLLRYGTVESISSDSIHRYIHNCEVIINTTPLGMNVSDPLPFDTELIQPNHTVFDIVYRPHTTPLLANALLKGAKIVYGSEMLFRQGIAQFELWTNTDPPIHEMRKTLYRAIGVDEL